MTDISETTPDVLGQILSPVIPLIRNEACEIEDDTDTYRLSFSFFTLSILYAVIKGIGSINLLITHIRTSPHAKDLKLADVSKSMCSEAFGRYSPSACRHMFHALLERSESYGNSRSQRTRSFPPHRQLRLSRRHVDGMGFLQKKAQCDKASPVFRTEPHDSRPVSHHAGRHFRKEDTSPVCLGRCHIHMRPGLRVLRSVS